MAGRRGGVGTGSHAHLVIKDDYVTAQNISAILASDGAVVETASLGEER
jgi:hypothetical protein